MVFFDIQDKSSWPNFSASADAFALNGQTVAVIFNQGLLKSSFSLIYIGPFELISCLFKASIDIFAESKGYETE